MLHSQRASLTPAATARRSAKHSGAFLYSAAGSPLRNSRPFGFSLVTRARRAISFALRSVSHLGVFFLAAELAAAGEGLPYEEPDLTQLSLEQLVNVKVYSACKFTQKASEAPSAVTVITRADIKAYGYRTLADVPRSIRKPGAQF